MESDNLYFTKSIVYYFQDLLWGGCEIELPLLPIRVKEQPPGFDSD